MYEYKAVITNIVDGDTFDMDIDLGFHIHIHERVRLLDVDTPEKFGEEKNLGLIMKQYATDRFLGKEVVIKSEKADIAADTDSFGRWLVKVYVPEYDADISSIYNNIGVNKKYYTYKVADVLKLQLRGDQNELHVRNSQYARS
jgi:micrococcal nuclease